MTQGMSHNFFILLADDEIEQTLHVNVPNTILEINVINPRASVNTSRTL
jgi:hypothetical protein